MLTAVLIAAVAYAAGLITYPIIKPLIDKASK